MDLDLEWHEILVLVIFFISSYTLVFLSGYLVEDLIYVLKDKTSSISAVEDCTNLSLEESVICIMNNVSSYYNYTVRNELTYTGDDGSLEDVMKNGGDCFDYSNIYKNLFKKLDLRAETFGFHGEDAGHRLTIVWDNEMTGYCIVDLVSYQCWWFDLEMRGKYQDE